MGADFFDVFALAGTDTLSTAESIARRNTLGRPGPETRTTADSPVQDYDARRALAETLAAADVATRIVLRPRTSADTLALSESVARRDNLGRAIADAVSRAEAVLRTYNPKRAISDQWSTGVGPILDSLPPDYIRFAFHFPGPVSFIQDDPDAADANWLGDGQAGEIRVSFPLPPAALTTGADLQAFRIRVQPG
jgi:hypothetical protein